ncbi:hypothetical protein HELRODRAFT_192271 [Helobdella robusta]|uniref:Conserved oligomeric Golgi complex subunit 1 n=1 Tax=Helobdella robusta TaxID=6412 RepID=T1FTS3_HELRO|nr:hypothetical protein HELRODRAFT_192271 [Helobdella robusta]ESO01256.1 hypothetical protein HELRODRAFT_192271 [Helobdella robusta]
MIPINFKEIESGVIFEKHTIDEINGIEKRIRQEIDKKKEELRQMVGQRYRELIEAADTITDMKNGSEKVLESIQKLQKLCQNLKEKSSSLSSKQPVSNLTEEEMTHRSNSACLKILLELPSKIWCHMDDNEYLESSRIYLLGQHIHAHLCSGMDEQLIGLVVKHWGNVGHLKKVIIKLVVDCLCTLSLLVNKPVDAVFKEFLDIRIQQFNSVAPSSNGSSAGLSSNGSSSSSSSSGSGGGGSSNSSRDVQSIKPLICDIVDNFTSTLRQIHYLFFAPVSNDDGNGNGANFEMDNLFSRTLMNCLNKDSSDFIKKSEILSEQAINLLPKTVLNFKPTVKSELKPLEKDFVKNETKTFVEKSTRSVNSGFSSLFEYIVNITSLASTRRDVITVIKKNCKKCDWPKICNDVIGHDLDIWKEFLKGHFIKRMKTLIEQHVSLILSSTKTDISDTLNRTFHAKSNKPTSSSTTTTSMFERDISTYIWLEGKTDIDLSIIWGGPIRSSASGSSGSSSSGLAMKAKGYTPEIQSLNHSLNSKLRSLLDEVASYASQSEKASLAAATPTSSSNHFLFRNDNSDNDDDNSLNKNSNDADDDMSKVQELLRTTCEKFTIEIIFIGRWATSLSETCPSLKSSMTEVDAAAAASDVIVTSSSPHGMCKMYCTHYAHISTKSAGTLCTDRF